MNNLLPKSPEPYQEPTGDSLVSCTVGLPLITLLVWAWVNTSSLLTPDTRAQAKEHWHCEKIIQSLLNHARLLID